MHHNQLVTRLYIYIYTQQVYVMMYTLLYLLLGRVWENGHRSIVIHAAAIKMAALEVI